MNNDINYNINEDNSSDSGDNRGKFSDRLKKIRRDRLAFRRGRKEHFLKTGARNALKIFLAIPSVAYSIVKTDNKDDGVDQLVSDYTFDNVGIDRKIKVNKIREINVASLRKKKELALKKRENVTAEKSEEDIRYTNIIKGAIDNVNIVYDEKERRIYKLQKEIIDLIKKQLVKNINELELLQSELYLFKAIDGDDIYLKECQDKIKEIKRLLSRINALKEKYDYLKDNYDFEYIYAHGDEILVDKILELKDLCNKDDVKYIVDNYKILEEYKYLYLKIDKLQDETFKYEKYRHEKEMELKERDINFEKLKQETYNIDMENQKYTVFIREQESLFKQLEDKVSKINYHEKVTYKLKGFNELVANSFKFVGLLLLNPFKGLLPNIAMHTAMTKKTISNLYNGLEFEERKRLVYEADDYSLSIIVAQSSLSDTLSLVNSTLDDICNLKKRYKQQFEKYQYSISSYKDTLKKLNKIENSMLGNKIKIELMQEKMRIKEIENNKKLEKVKKLNTSIDN